MVVNAKNFWRVAGGKKLARELARARDMGELSGSNVVREFESMGISVSVDSLILDKREHNYFCPPVCKSVPPIFH